jgi:hypothetical protein
MAQNYTDESNNPKTDARYTRTYYSCAQDDVWITAELPKSPQPPATIVYQNWRGETAERHIIPLRFWYGTTEWHKDNQWFMKALDTDKQTERDFALKDVQQWIR